MLVHPAGFPQVTVSVLLIPHRPSAAVRVLRCIRECLTDELHERDQKEENDEKHGLNMVHHVIFENGEPVVYRLFDTSTTSRGRRKKASGLTLTVLSKKFSEFLALIVPFTMLSKVDTILEYVSWILDP